MLVKVSRFKLSAANEAYRIIQIKRKANIVALAEFPEWKQRNALAREFRLLRSSLARELTPEEALELLIGQQMWDRIFEIRQASDAAESDGTPVRQFNP